VDELQLTLVPPHPCYGRLMDLWQASRVVGTDRLGLWVGAREPRLTTCTKPPGPRNQTTSEMQPEPVWDTGPALITIHMVASCEPLVDCDIRQGLASLDYVGFPNVSLKILRPSSAIKLPLSTL